MLQNNIFPIYDKKYKKLLDGYVYPKYSFCEKCLKDPNKKCSKYYDNIDLEKDGIYSCPYGLSTIVHKGNILTSIIVNENISGKTRNNFEYELKHGVKFTTEQAMILVKKSIERDMILERYKETVHDLRNMASYFNSMIDEFKEEKGDKELTSNEMSLISLYELINFRLDILYGKVDLTDIIEKEQKLHPIVAKLNYILRYKARQKGIKVNISNKQQNSFNITKSLYLSLFILMENAIKYAKPNTTIEINFDENSEHSIIKISNISEKINEIDGNKLIQKGVRGSNATNLGSGIGLAFAYELLEEMGAELKIELIQKNDKETLFVSSVKLEGVVAIYK